VARLVRGLRVKVNRTSWGLVGRSDRARTRRARFACPGPTASKLSICFISEKHERCRGESPSSSSSPLPINTTKKLGKTYLLSITGKTQQIAALSQRRQEKWSQIRL